MISINTNGLEVKLDRIIALLEGLSETGHPVAQEAETVKPAPETPATPAVEPQAEPEPEQDKPVVDPEELLSKISALVRKLASPKAGKRAEAKAIIEQYATNVSSIPEDKLAEALEQLEGLDNGA